MKKISLEQLFLWTLTGCLALGQLGRIVLTPAIKLYPHDIVIVLWSVYLLISQKQHLKNLCKTTQNYLWQNKQYWMPFFAVTTVSLVFVELRSPQLLPLLYVARITLYGVFAYLVWSVSELSSQKILSAVLGLGIISLVTGLLQYIFIPDTRFLFILGFDDHYYRMIGTQLDPAFMGAILLISLSVLEQLRSLQKKATLRRFLYLAFVLGIALTFSRASYIGFLVLSGYGVLVQKKLSKKLTLLPLVGSLLGILLIIGIGYTTSGEGTNLLRTASIQARLTTLQSSVPTNFSEALIGTGLFYSAVNRESTTTGIATVPNQAKISDSLLGILLQGVGILGILAFVYLFGTVLVRLHQAQKYALVQLLLMLLVITQFNNTLLQPFVLVTTLLVASGYLREYR